MPAVTIRDVAREADVSVATVSRVLNGVATVDPSLAVKVRAAADALGYVPNGVGRALRLQHTNSWAVIVQGLNAFIAQVVAAVEAGAERHGTSVYLGITDYDEERERRYLQTSRSQRVAGLIVGGSASSSNPFVDVGVPVVFIDRGLPGSPHDSVSIDNRGAGRLMASHLHEQGFTRVACIGDDEEGSPVLERGLGFIEECRALGMEVPEEFVRFQWPSITNGKEALLALARLPEPPEVVFCANGPLTEGAHLGLQSEGVPDIALTGVDDEEWTALATPSVTVIRQPVVEIGERAVALLLDRVAGSKAPPVNVVLAPELIVRDSTRRPPRTVV